MAKVATVQIESFNGCILKADVYEPAKILKGGNPTAGTVHGGGWAVGKRQQNANVALDLAKAGFRALTLDYQLMKNFLPGQKAPAIYPTQPEDIRAWVRYLRTIEGGNGQVLLYGGSAGGTNAATAGLSGDDRPDALILMSAAYDFSDEESLADNTPPLYFARDVLAYNNCAAEQTDILYNNSPMSMLDGDIPPMFMVQGELDTLPHTQLPKMVEALEARGFNKYQAEYVPNGGHASDNWYKNLATGQPCNEAAIETVKRWLR